MSDQSSQLQRNRVKIALIALGLFALGKFGPGLDDLFDQGPHGHHFEDRIDRIAAEADRAAAYAERAAELAERVADEAEARADRARF
ncbi:MAG: hypothetical protein ACKVOP_04120 [Sphingomonadaceae bacterium]